MTIGSFTAARSAPIVDFTARTLRYAGESTGDTDVARTYVFADAQDAAIFLSVPRDAAPTVWGIDFAPRAPDRDERALIGAALAELPVARRGAAEWDLIDRILDPDFWAKRVPT